MMKFVKIQMLGRVLNLMCVSILVSSCQEIRKEEK